MIARVIQRAIDRVRGQMATWRSRKTTDRQERAFRQMGQLMEEMDWDEFTVRSQAADYALELLYLTDMATGNAAADYAEAWELGRLLRQLHVEAQRRKGARSP